MNDISRTDGPQPAVKGGESGRLDSWKKIAVHFKRDVTTVQRWERREGMPVHRHLHDKQGSVYAFKAELDAWWQSRANLGQSAENLVAAEGESIAGLPPASSDIPPAVADDASRAKRNWSIAIAGAGALLLLYAVVVRLTSHQVPSWHNPLANATVTRLTDWPGIEQAAEISRDGKWAAFLADRDGHMDAWLTQIGSGNYRNLTQGRLKQLVNPSTRTLGFAADGSEVTVWTRSADGSRPEDIKLMAAPLTGGELDDFLPGVAEVSWSHEGSQIVYHTTAPGDPLFVRNADGTTRKIYAATAGEHCHYPIWSQEDDYIYFTRGVPPSNWDIWRIRPSGEGLERITFHNSQVSHPVLIDERTLVYLASDPQGSGPWLYAADVEQRVPHLISFGLERYTSIAASADGERLVATVDESNSSIWSSPLPVPSGAPVTQAVSLVSGTGQSPRRGPDYLLYVSERAGRVGIWKSTDGGNRELWSDARATIVGTPAVSADGKQIAFAVAGAAQTMLYTMDSDGKALRAVATSLALRGNPAWAPDGRSIVSAVLHDGEPRLTNIFLDGSPPAPLVSEYSVDPVWSPDGRFLIYSGADVGTTFPLRAVAADGRPYPIPALILTRGARRVAFGADANSLVVLRGEMGHKNFFLIDLRTGAAQQVSDLAPDIVIRDFDVTREGKLILFDRVHESSRIALIERGGQGAGRSSP